MLSISKIFKLFSPDFSLGNKSVFYFILFFFALEVSAQQNYVKNGSFEDYIDCPEGQSSPGSYQLEKCLNWHTPTLATSDYINICNNTSVSIPTNFGGYQWPRSGNAYAAIAALYDYQELYCEYVQGELFSLQAGKFYTLSFYVSFAEGYSTFSISKLGAALTSTQIFESNSLSLQLMPVVISNSNLSDTSGWQKISGEFFATGDEKFVTIGYFGPQDFSDTTFFQNADSGIPRVAYYFIDDVSIMETSASDNINVFTPNNDLVNDFIDFSSYTSAGLDVIILNRWGNVVFRTSLEESIWSGVDQQSGEQVSDGVYFLQIWNKDKIYKTDYIHLMR